MTIVISILLHVHVRACAHIHTQFLYTHTHKPKRTDKTNGDYGIKKKGQKFLKEIGLRLKEGPFTFNGKKQIFQFVTDFQILNNTFYL